MAAKTNHDRLGYYNEYPMPDYSGMPGCSPTADGRPRVRNPEGTHRCRIISKLKDRASGYELFQNKIKKWITRKLYITKKIMKRIEKKFPKMNEKDQIKIFKIFLMAVDGHEETDRDFRNWFAQQINSSNDRIDLPNPEEMKEFFHSHYTTHKLFNPKSQNITCMEDVDVLKKIKGLHSNRCILAYKNNNKTGFENYADYLLDILNTIPPKNIAFNKAMGNQLIPLSNAYFLVP